MTNRRNYHRVSAWVKGIRAGVRSEKGEVMVQKKTVKNVAKKPAKKAVKKGDVYECTVCGLAVTVDEVCGCMDTCDIICCEKQMKPES